MFAKANINVEDGILNQDCGNLQDFDDAGASFYGFPRKRESTGPGGWATPQ